MSPAGESLWRILRAAERQVRRDVRFAIAAGVLAVPPSVLLVAWLFGGRWSSPSAGPLVLEVLALLAMGVLLLVWGRRWLGAVNEKGIAASAEAARGLAPGSVRGLLELNRSLPAGVSPALYHRAESELARVLAGAEPRELAGALGLGARRRRARWLGALGALTGLVVVLGFASPERSRAGWTPLLNPVAAWTTPSLPALALEPGDAQVPRGGGLQIRIVAPEREEVVLHWRAEGEVPHERRLLVGDGQVSTRISGIDAPVVYWAAAPDGARTRRYRIEPLDPLLVADLTVDVIYPEHVGREPERFRGDVPPLVLPQGTQLEIRGRGTRALESAVLARTDGGMEVPLVIRGDGFVGRWTPSSSGIFEWRLEDRVGDTLASPPSPLDLTVLPDERPRVEIVFPGTDTVLPGDMRQPLVADARDDYGLRSATLVSWRAGAGRRDAPVEERIALSGQPERAVLRPVLDASHRNLVPGDTLYYFIQVVDNSPAGQVGRSETYRLRVPGVGDLRQRAREEARSAAREAEAVARSARELETETRNLARQAEAWPSRGEVSRSRPAGGGVGGGAGGERQALPRADEERVRQALDREEALLDRVREMRERADRLQEALEAAGLRDPELQQRLRELRELYDQVLSSEQTRRAEAMRESLEARDPEQLREDLERMAADQQELRERMDRSAELLRRAALEQRLNEAANEARELTRQQEALAEAMKTGEDAEKRAEQQEALERQAEALQETLEQLRQELEQQGETEAAAQTEAAQEDVRAAQESMRQAQSQARENQPQEAGEAAEDAAAQLDQASSTLDEARKDMAARWRQEVQDAVQQATEEALALAERQQQILDRMQEGQESGGQSFSPPQLRPELPQLGQPQDQQAQGDGSGERSGEQAQGGQPEGAGQDGQGREQPGGEQSGGQQRGQQSGGSQAAGDQGGREGGGSQAGGQEGRAQGDSPQGAHGGQQGPQPAGGYSTGEMDALRSEQTALRQGLENLGRNLAEAGRSSALLDREVSEALSQAMRNIEQTLEGLSGNERGPGMPTDAAAQSVESLNQLALALLANSQRIAEAESGTGLQEALDRLAELAQEQRALNNELAALVPLDLSADVMGDRLERLSRQQREISTRLDGMSEVGTGREGLWGELEALAREAEHLARELSGGRFTPEVLARQERLFHRLLDAGRTLERDEVRDVRVAERPEDVGVSEAAALEAALLDARLRYPVPTPEELRALPAAYRRMVLEYFDRLNRPLNGREADRPEERRP